MMISVFIIYENALSFGKSFRPFVVYIKYRLIHKHIVFLSKDNP